MHDGSGTRDETATWGDIAGGLGASLGGVILALQAAVVIPGLLPAVALGVLLLLPIVVLAAAGALVVGAPLAVVRLTYRALRR